MRGGIPTSIPHLQRKLPQFSPSPDACASLLSPQGRGKKWMAHRGKGEEKSGMQGKGRKKGVQPVRTFKGEGKKAMCGEREKEKGVRPAAEERGRREREKRGCAQGKRRGEKGGCVRRKGGGEGRGEKEIRGTVEHLRERREKGSVRGKERKKSLRSVPSI